MARYIDADALIAEMKSNINTYWNEGGGGYYLAEDAIEHSVETAPTADLVPKSEVDLYRKQVDELEDELASTYDKLEDAKSEVEKILAEIERQLNDFNGSWADTVTNTQYLIDELRKKYT